MEITAYQYRKNLDTLKDNPKAKDRLKAVIALNNISILGRTPNSEEEFIRVFNTPIPGNPYNRKIEKNEAGGFIFTTAGKGENLYLPFDFKYEANIREDIKWMTTDEIDAFEDFDIRVHGKNTVSAPKLKDCNSIFEYIRKKESYCNTVRGYVITFIGKLDTSSSDVIADILDSLKNMNLKDIKKGDTDYLRPGQ